MRSRPDGHRDEDAYGWSVGGNLLVDSCRQCQHVSRQHPASGHQRGHRNVGRHLAMGGHRLFAGRRCSHRDIRLPGRRLRSEKDLPAGLGAVCRLLRADRARQHRWSGDRWAHDPRCSRCDDPGLRAQPALGGQHRPGAVAGGVVVGCGGSGGRRGRAASRRCLGGDHRMAGAVLDRRGRRCALHGADLCSR